MARRPRKKTIKYLQAIDQAVKVQCGGEINRKELRQLLKEKFGLGNNRIYELIRQYTREGKELIERWGTEVEIIKVDAHLNNQEPEAQLVTTDRLPKNEEELKQYRYVKILSPEAQAMRLDALNNAILAESGIARIKALELLEEMTKEYADNSNVEEQVFYNVYPANKKNDPKEE